MQVIRVFYDGKCCLCIGPIISESEHASVISKCGHTFHEKCLQQVRQKTCPVCRQSFSNEDVDCPRFTTMSETAKELLKKGTLMLGGPERVELLLAKVAEKKSKLEEQEEEEEEEEKEEKDSKNQVGPDPNAFLLKVKRRFESNPGMFKSFLDLLGKMKQGDSVEEAAYFLRDHPDLFEGLQEFLE